MEVDLILGNPALTSLTDPHPIINLDANFLIPPRRDRLARRSFDFPTFKDKWLDPTFHAFPNLAIHEAVYEELVRPSVKTYTEAMLSSNPIRLILYKNSTIALFKREKW